MAKNKKTEAPVPEDVEAETAQAPEEVPEGADTPGPEEAPEQEAPKAPETEEPVEKQIAPKLTEALRNGETRVELQLTPENLGELVIEMTRDAGGALQVVLHASTSRAAGLLTEHLPGLHAALQAQSAQAVHVEVQRGQESQQQNLHQQTDPNGHHQQHRQQEDKLRHPAAGTLAPSAAAGSAGGAAAPARAYRTGSKAGTPLFHVLCRAGDMLFPASGSIHKNHSLRNHTLPAERRMRNRFLLYRGTAGKTILKFR